MTVKDYKKNARKALSGKYGFVIGVSLVSGMITLLPVIPALICFLCGLGFAAYRRYGMNTGLDLYGSGLGHGLFSEGMIAAGSSVLFAVLAALCICLMLVLVFLLWIGMQHLYLNICRGAFYRFGDLFYAFRRGSRQLRILGAEVLSFLILFLLNIIYLIGIFLSVKYAPYSMLLVIIWAVVWLILYLYICYGISQVPLILIDRPATPLGRAFSESMRIMKGRKLQYFWLNLSFIFWNIPIWLTFYIASLWISPYISCSNLFFYLDASGELPKNGSGQRNTEEEAEKEDTGDQAGREEIKVLPEVPEKAEEPQTEAPQAEPAENTPLADNAEPSENAKSAENVEPSDKAQMDHE